MFASRAALDPGRRRNMRFSHYDEAPTACGVGVRVQVVSFSSQGCAGAGRICKPSKGVGSKRGSSGIETSDGRRRRPPEALRIREKAIAETVKLLLF